MKSINKIYYEALHFLILKFGLHSDEVEEFHRRPEKAAIHYAELHGFVAPGFFDRLSASTRIVIALIIAILFFFCLFKGWEWLNEPTDQEQKQIREHYRKLGY